MKATTIRLPADVVEFLDREHAFTGVPKVRIIADALRAVRDGNRKTPCKTKPKPSR